MFSPRYVYTVLPIQKTGELSNQVKRINIINDYAPYLSEEEVAMLCRKTRLLIRKEIEAVVHHYLQVKEVKIPLKSGANAYDPYRSNTVDPDAGWWAEHLINPYHIVRVLDHYGYNAKIMAGYYRRYGAFINPLIAAIGAPLSLPIAAYYTVYAKKHLLSALD